MNAFKIGFSFVIAFLIGIEMAGARTVLKVGTSVIGSPWSFHDATSSSERGIAIDLVTEIGKGGGYSIQLVPMPTIVELIAAPDALGVRKTDGELLKKINMSLAKLKADGSMKSIFANCGIDWTPPKLN
jgi:ABC-type amino acid transport substrate-binding protein